MLALATAVRRTLVRLTLGRPMLVLPTPAWMEAPTVVCQMLAEVGTLAQTQGWTGALGVSSTRIVFLDTFVATASARLLRAL